MKRIKFIIMVALGTSFLSCNMDNSDIDDLGYAELHYTFADGYDGWTSGFADYPKDSEDFYELNVSHVGLPDPLDSNRKALKIEGNNHSDDLFMFFKRKISGLQPNTTYYVSFHIRFATNVPDNMTGIGGSPGESVYIKAGGSTIEPVVELDTEDNYRMNIDKGNQSQGGANMIVLGDFSNDTNVADYVLKSVYKNNAIAIKSNESGEFWLIVGSDSGFEGKTALYITNISMIFQW